MTPPMRVLGSDSSEQISLEGSKAIFFVKSFEGKGHDDLRFHDHLVPMECLWVRVTFLDGEVIEGNIRNGSEAVLERAFFKSPTDPEGNNWLAYIFKSQLKDFQVLGMRPAPRNLPRLSPVERAG